MKQTILALGAAAALGFAGTAHAIAFFGQGDDANRNPASLPMRYDYTARAERPVALADVLKQAVGGVGHMLFMPYYNTQEGTATMFNITNTDPLNGKAVKVRLRGASNSDDVYDFTVLLSPGDMWSAALMHDKTGKPTLTTADHSCTIPTSVNGALKPGRLADVKVSDATKQVLISEGYIEVLNMADIPATIKDGANWVTNKLHADILHAVEDGKPNTKSKKGFPEDCNGAPIQTLLTDVPVNQAGATAAGLASSTGGLMGSWIILNQNKVATYSGNMTAIRAETTATGENGYGTIIFSPQVSGSIGDSIKKNAGGWMPSYTTALTYATPTAGDAAVHGLTADPLLNKYYNKKDAIWEAPVLDPKWFDLPDMSTPLLTKITSPQQQVMSLKLAHMHIYNEYLADPSGAGPSKTPMLSDWVISQPTRRYYAAVDYKGERLYWNEAMPTESTALALGGANAMSSIGRGSEVTVPVSANAYAGLKYLADPFPKSKHGPFACMEKFTAQALDREEFYITSLLGGAISPGEEVVVPFCGEVFMVKFGGRSVMNAKVATIDFPNIAGIEGWASINFGNYKGDVRRLPVVGFAATHYENPSTSKNYGATWPHRWDH